MDMGSRDIRRQRDHPRLRTRMILPPLYVQFRNPDEIMKVMQLGVMTSHWWVWFDRVVVDKPHFVGKSKHSDILPMEIAFVILVDDHGMMCSDVTSNGISYYIV